MEESESKGKGRIFINIFIIIVIILVGIYLYARYVEPSRLIMKEYKVSNENIPSNFSGIKIIHISDLYFGNTTDISDVDKLVDNINLMKPDIILFSGNLYGNNIKKENELITSLSKIESKLGKYAVKGNNDYHGNYVKFMETIGFKVLENNYELIYNDDLTPIYLCGLNSSLKESINLDDCLSYFEDENNKNIFKIYMVHESDASKELLSSANPDMIVTGNSLGGLINIPFVGSVISINGSKKYKDDYYKVNGVDIFVSSGIGTDKYPYRFLSAPSFNLYRLKSLK